MDRSALSTSGQPPLGGLALCERCPCRSCPRESPRRVRDTIEVGPRRRQVDGTSVRKIAARCPCRRLAWLRARGEITPGGTISRRCGRDRSSPPVHWPGPPPGNPVTPVCATTRRRCATPHERLRRAPTSGRTREPADGDAGRRARGWVVGWRAGGAGTRSPGVRDARQGRAPPGCGSDVGERGACDQGSKLRRACLRSGIRDQGSSSTTR